jgi:hypothetical protein
VCLTEKKGESARSNFKDRRAVLKKNEQFQRCREMEDEEENEI